MHHDIIGTSAALQEVLARADKAAASAARVLITGETGTGKELLARRLHAKSGRAGGPFVALNCAALPEALLESELFGHVRGAFSEAHRTHEGLAAAAHGGVLFLDEIGEMSLALQAKLLRFLETGEYRKVGATATERADVRIISATHRDVPILCRQGLFRDDLYYRLAVLTLSLPPLRARREDILPLAHIFLLRCAAEEGRDVPAFTPAAAQALLHHPWPGNVRELQNIIHRAVALHDAAAVDEAMLGLSMLPPAANVVTLGAFPAVPPRPLWQVEQDAIAAAIRFCHGNIPRAATLLQVSPSTLYRRRDSAATPHE